MSNFNTNRGALDLLSNVIVWATDSIKIRLVPSSVTPDKDNTVMTGLTAIGTDQVLGSKTRTEDTANDRIVYDAADPTWTAVSPGNTIGWAIVYKFGTNDADSVPICVIDLSDIPTNGSDVTVQFDTTGIFYLQQ
jgi:hypothetical protein